MQKVHPQQVRGHIIKLFYWLVSFLWFSFRASVLLSHLFSTISGNGGNSSSTISSVSLINGIVSIGAVSVVALTTVELTVGVAALAEVWQ